MRQDIKDKQDIEKLITTFYSKLIENEEMRVFFKEVDWQNHLPRMIGFWEFIIFSTPNAYTGSMMQPHFSMHEKHPMTDANFKTWIRIFQETVDELFEGPKADDAKNAAFTIGATLKYKVLQPKIS